MTGHRVGDEQDLLRVEQRLERLHLLHHVIVNMQAARGIDDQKIAAAIHGFAPTFFGEALDGRRVGEDHIAFVQVGLDRLSYNFQLLASCRAINVDRDQHRPMSALLEPRRQLSRRRGFTRSLQSRHQDDGWRLRRKLELRRVAAENLDQLVVDDPHHLLRRR